MHKDESITSGDLDRPEGNSLEENYDLHDIGQIHITQHVEDLGLHVKPWGIDEREADGDDGLIFDDAADLKITDDDGNVVAIVEIKTKSSEDWFGIINRRHYKHYLTHVHEFDRPVFIYMALVSEEKENSIGRNAFIPLQRWDEFDEAFEDDSSDVTEFMRELGRHSPQVDREFSAPDGNRVVKLDEDSYIGWAEFAYFLGEQTDLINVG